MKYFVIGDVHGCRAHLEKLLDTILPMFQAGDVLLFLGDYVDRGPDCKGVIDIVRSLQKEGFKTPDDMVIALKGNHEDEMVHERPKCPILMGGEATWRSFGLSPDETKITSDYYEWMDKLPLKYQTKDFFFCHAGIDPTYTLDEQPEHVLLWTRYEYDMDIDGPRIVHGHTPGGGVYHGKHRTNLDTGAVFGGYLSCGIFTEGDRDGIEIVAVSRDMEIVRDKKVKKDDSQ